MSTEYLSTCHIRLLMSHRCSPRGAHRWQAFIFYAYFEKVSFAPQRSQGLAAASAQPISRYNPPLCSPKSMCRLADKASGGRIRALVSLSLVGAAQFWSVGRWSLHK